VTCPTLEASITVARSDAHIEQVGVDAEPSRQHEIDLRASLPAIREECLAVLERVVPLCVGGEQAAGDDLCAIARRDDAHAVGRDDERRLHANAEEVGVHAVLPWRQHIDLRALLATGAQERLAILIRVMTGHASREDVPRIERAAIDRLDETDLILGDPDHGRLPDLEEVGDHEVQPGRKHTSLDADLAGHRDHSALGQAAAEVAALDDADLLAADVHQRTAGKDDQEQEQRGKQVEHPAQLSQ
jgi:hypothetical protein